MARRKVHDAVHAADRIVAGAAAAAHAVALVVQRQSLGRRVVERPPGVRFEVLALRRPIRSGHAGEMHIRARDEKADGEAGGHKRGQQAHSNDARTG